MIGNDFETGTEPAGVELNARIRANNPIALVPPRRVGIAHDLAHALIKKERPDWTKEWKDQVKAHGETLRRRRTGLSGRFLPGILIVRAGFLGPVELQDGVDADLPRCAALSRSFCSRIRGFGARPRSGRA